MKKCISIMVICAIFVACFPISVQAGSHYIEWTKTSSASFSKKWSDTKTWKIENEDGLYVSTVYGYDTFATKEDYVKSCKGTLGHKAYVKNSDGTSVNTGWYKGSTSAKGNPSHKVDVKHTGVPVTYRLYADYD